MLKDISVYILTLNEEKSIKRCLAHLGCFADVVVVDGGSTDKTLEIVSQFPQVRVFKNPWPGFVKQRVFAISKTRNDWVLQVDADEVANEKLCNEIVSLQLDANRIVGYLIPCQDYFYGRWIHHGDWYPQYHLRLFNKTKVSYDQQEIVHEKFIYDKGKTADLTNPLLHFSHLTINHTLKTFMQYTDLEARILYKKMKQRTPLLLVVLMFYHMARQFFGRYFIKQGFRDGIHGLIIALLMSFYYFLIYAKLLVMNYRSNKTLRT
ncbi:glycosyltransferase family 2 protein [Patescibacteria group bacterium]|nr:glycosyltransferase family 2 protein [Patescibacteria group bacterium]